MYLFRHSEAIKELKNGSTMGQTRFWWSVSPRVAVAALKDSDSGNNTLNGSTMQEKKERKKKKKGRALCESIPSRIRRGTKEKKKNCNLFFLFFSWYCVRETFRLNRDPSLRNIKLPIFSPFFLLLLIRHSLQLRGEKGVDDNRHRFRHPAATCQSDETQ